MTASFMDSSHVEIGVLGYEALHCASVLMGSSHSLNRVYMQIVGRGYATSNADAKLEFKRNGQFHDLALRSNQDSFLQTAQTAGCNARHTVEQRFARWLLLVADRMESPVLTLPHLHIAAMLGCNRSTVTVVACRMQHDQIIQYNRSKILILDRPRLEALSCECYRSLADYLEANARTDAFQANGPPLAAVTQSPIANVLSRDPELNPPRRQNQNAKIVIGVFN